MGERLHVTEFGVGGREQGKKISRELNWVSFLLFAVQDNLASLFKLC